MTTSLYLTRANRHLVRQWLRHIPIVQQQQQQLRYFGRRSYDRKQGTLEDEFRMLEEDQLTRRLMSEEEDLLSELDGFNDDVRSSAFGYEASRPAVESAVHVNVDNSDGGNDMDSFFKVVDPWEVSEDDIALNLQFEDLPVWSEETITKISRDRLTFCVQKDGDGTCIPDLTQLADMPLPLPAPPVPSEDKKAYKQYRKRAQKIHIYNGVAAVAKPEVLKILRMEDDKKQAAVDALFERMAGDVKKEIPMGEVVYFGDQPKFNEIVEKSLIDYLKAVRRREGQRADAITIKAQEKSSINDIIENEEEKNESRFHFQKDADSAPTFMDFRTKGVDKYFSSTGIPGRITEDWELSADKEARMIMIREPMRRIAQEMLNCKESGKAAKVFVTGKQGVGKSVAISTIVAAARKEGSIVLFVPNVSKLRSSGKYVEPSTTHSKMFDVPLLSMSFLQQLYDAHGDQLEDLNLTIKKNIALLPDDLQSGTLRDIVKTGKDSIEVANVAFIATMSELMTQDNFAFYTIFDEYNSWFDSPLYYHMDYKGAETPIPHYLISAFQPMLTMGFGKNNSSLMKKGGIIAAIDNTRPVKRSATVAACEQLRAEGALEVSVGRYSHTEFDHILSHYERVGIGKLRIYGADVLENEEEIAFLRMLTGCIGSKLLNSIII